MIALMRNGPVDGQVIMMDSFCAIWTVLKPPELAWPYVLEDAVPMVSFIQGHYTPARAMYGAVQCYMWSVSQQAIIYDWRGWDEEESKAA